MWAINGFKPDPTWPMTEAFGASAADLPKSPHRFCCQVTPKPVSSETVAHHPTCKGMCHNDCRTCPGLRKRSTALYALCDPTRPGACPANYRMILVQDINHRKWEADLATPRGGLTIPFSATPSARRGRFATPRKLHLYSLSPAAGGLLPQT